LQNFFAATYGPEQQKRRKISIDHEHFSKFRAIFAQQLFEPLSLKKILNLLDKTGNLLYSPAGIKSSVRFFFASCDRTNSSLRIKPRRINFYYSLWIRGFFTNFTPVYHCMF